MRSDYKICPLCGAALDIGEQCNCREYREKPQGSKSPLEIYAQGSRYTPGASTPKEGTRSPKGSPGRNKHIIASMRA